MGKKYQQLSLEERCAISSFQTNGKSIRQIAAALDRSPSTIAREIKRNRTKTLGYKPTYAQEQTAARRWQGSRLERQPELRSAVLDLLTMGWSPQQASERLARERGCKLISAESIYRFIYAQIKRTKDYLWCNYLPQRKSYRRALKPKKVGSLHVIKNRISIHERPTCVNDRAQPGHWEADLMLFSKPGQALLFAHERQSRLLLVSKLLNKQAHTVMTQLVQLFNHLPTSLIKTITFDNGFEFSEHERLHELGMKTYFCDAYSPWQKGGIENSIGRMRRFLARKTDLDQVKHQQIEQFVARYNHTPRKCIDYRTPAEVFIKQLLHFECESTPASMPA